MKNVIHEVIYTYDNQLRSGKVDEVVLEMIKIINSANPDTNKFCDLYYSWKGDEHGRNQEQNRRPQAFLRPQR